MQVAIKVSYVSIKAKTIKRFKRSGNVIRFLAPDLEKVIIIYSIEDPDMILTTGFERDWYEERVLDFETGQLKDVWDQACDKQHTEMKV